MGRFGRWAVYVAVALAVAGLGCDSDDSDPWSPTGGSGGASSGSGGSSSGTGGSSSGTGGSSSSGTGGAGATGDLPEGDSGIAADYPNDQGIDGHPDVIFADDFESYGQPDDLWNRWDNVHHMNQIRIAAETENVFGGSQALEFTVPAQNDELSNAVSKILTEEQDILFLRYHSKYAAGFDVLGSSHNGSSISAHYYVNGQATPGVPADGTNKFLAAYESWRGEATTDNPGLLNIYIYHPEQRDNYGDHFFPSGLVMPNTSLPFDFGPDFVARPEVIPELDRWYAFEVMVKANTPGELDGRIACWVDGALIADFLNLRLRDVASLTIDRFSLNLHIKSNTAGQTHKWYDNAVAATSYIGPTYVP